MRGVNPDDCKRPDQLTTTSTFPFVVGIDFASSNAFRRENAISTRRPYPRHGADARCITPSTQRSDRRDGRTAGPYPDGVTDEQAAALPIAAIAALGSLELLGVTATSASL